MKISVALCTYNGEKYLAEQLNSILKQTQPVHEIIICDDRSSDQTISIVENFKSQSTGIIKLYINPRNLGGKKNFEKALSLCSGDIIFFSDQDDIWCENKVQVVVHTFKANPNCWGVGSDASLIDTYMDIPDSSFWTSLDFQFEDVNLAVKSSFCEYILSYGNVVAGAMMAIRRESLPLIYPFKFLEDMWHDEWIVLVLSGLGKFMLIKDKLVRYRLHEGQQIGLGNAKQESWLEYKRLLKDVNRLKQDHLLYFAHAWNTYTKFKRYESEVPDWSNFKEVFKNRFVNAKSNFLEHQNIIVRKARLLKWFVNKEFDTTLNELITL